MMQCSATQILKRLIKGVNCEVVDLLLLHELDLVDNIASDRIDLALAGHSHGGQVVVSFYGPLVTPLWRKSTQKRCIN